MTSPRKAQVCLEQTPYYHCIARCVRRAFLCGQDEFSGKSFEHRRQWIVDRLKELASIFTMDICAFAIMSNHYHVVLHVDKSQALALTDDEVIVRWRRLFKGHILIERMQSGADMTKAELNAASELINTWRERLYDISWFMRCLNEGVARQANEEDGCKGRFWEGRYKSQALLDEAALLTCMSYVDLNPIRAGIAETPETSDFTSIQERVAAYAGRNNQTASVDKEKAALAPFMDGGKDAPQQAIPFYINDYLQLVDWAGRAIRDDKRGAIPDHVAPILQRLGIAPPEWLNNVQYYGRRFHCVLGTIDTIKCYSANLGRCWARGQRAAMRMYQPLAS